MPHYNVVIEPRDLDPSKSDERDTLALGFVIRPPLKHIVDPEFLRKAADRVDVHGGFEHATLSHSDDEATYGTFETYGPRIGDVMERREEIELFARLVFFRALGTSVQVEFPKA